MLYTTAVDKTDKITPLRELRERIIGQKKKNQQGNCRWWKMLSRRRDNVIGWGRLFTQSGQE